MFRKYVADKLFYKELFIVIIPIILQFFIQNFINFLDNIMVGQLGEPEIAGVAVANQYYKLFYSMIVSICTGAAIFTAQFFGSKKYPQLQKMFGIKLVFPLMITMVFFIIGVMFPEKIILIFLDPSKEAERKAISYGVDYLKIAIYSYIPLTISTAFTFTFRPLKLTMIPMIASGTGMITNFILNIFLINGLWIFPELGVKGAAIGTLIARVIELSVYIYIFIKKDFAFKTKLINYFKLDFILIKKTFLKVLPLFINELFYSLALILIFKTYSDLGTSAVSVINIADIVSQIVFILASGLGTATSILVGYKLGNNELEDAEKNANYLLGYAVFMGIIIAVIISILAFIVPIFYNIKPETKILTTYAILIQGLVAPILMLTRIPFFVLRSGGRVNEVVLLDSVFMWVVKVPTALFFGYVLHVEIIPLFLSIEATRILNAIVSMYYYKQKKWLNNLTE